MADVAEIWAKSLPVIKQGVTGVGIWTALNTCKPLLVENGMFVLGLPHEDSELAGHLKLASTKRLIEQTIAPYFDGPMTLRVIEGTTLADWDLEKRRDAEKQRLNQQSMEKLRAELQARSSWDQIYDQLSRKYAAVSNKSLPQNRARFFEEGVELIAEARKGQTSFDDLGERNFARCLERLAQYAEIPSALVAREVLQRAGEI
ncbi:MAG: hypothetical protein BGO01_15285 [Armatimonadetes bacterium 55-13]|nr:hypothetical protein [Armatimonadota bacterium]OJU65229.1 MAG: hypothetical protein BGO01_15285 [Armatimonadetes bacterium 55-13]